MATNDINFKITMDAAEFERAVKRSTDTLKGFEKTGTTGVKSLTDAFGTLKTAAVALAGTAAFGAVVNGLKSVVAAAAEAEAVNVKLAVALKATGQFSQATVKGIDAWSQSLMNATGTSDELSKSLVTTGVSMGRTVEQSKRLVEAAANMGTVVGSTEAAMQMLIRASDGDVAALKRFGIEVTEAEVKSRDFESVLRKVESAFAGQAQAQMSTYAGKLNDLQNQFGELKEKVGGPLLDVLGNIVTAMSEGTKAATQFGDALEKITPGRIQDMLAIGALLTNNPALAMQLAMRGGPDFSKAPTQMMASHGPAWDSSQTVRSHGAPVSPGALFNTTVADPEAAKKAAADAKRLAEEAERIRLASLSLFETPAEYMERILKEAREIAAVMQRWNAPGLYTATEDIRAAQAQARAAQLRPEPFDVAMQGSLDQATAAAADASGQLADALEYDALQTQQAVDAKREAEREAMDSFAELSDQVWKSGMEIGKATKNWTDGLGPLALQGVGAVLGTALQGGNVGNAVAGVGGQLAGAGVSNALLSTLGKTFSPIVGGIAGSLVTSALGGLFDNAPKTAGGKARRELGSVLGGYGLGGNRSVSEEEFYGTGQADMWMKWAQMLSGSEKVGESGAIQLMDAFDELGLSAADASDAIALMAAESDPKKFGAAKMNAAFAALSSTAALTDTELQGLLSSYREGKSWQDSYNAAMEKLRADAARGNLSAVKADRSNIIGLLGKAEEEKKQTEALLQQAGVSQSQIDLMKSSKDIEAEQLGELRGIRQALGGRTNGTGGTAPLGGGTAPLEGGTTGGEFVHSGAWPMYHQGKMYGGYPSHKAIIRDDEMVVPPERYRDAIEYMTSRIGGGGSTSIVVNVSGAVGNHREIAKRIHAELGNLRRTREIAA